MDFKEIIPVWLIELRLKAKLSQEELAAEIGVSRSAIRGWETGEYLPNAYALIRLSDFYGVSVDFILGRDEMDTLYVGNVSMEFTMVISELIRLFGKRQTDLPPM